LSLAAGRDQPAEKLPGPPAHIEEAVQFIAMLHNAHHKNVSRLEKLVDFASAQVSCLVLMSRLRGWSGYGRAVVEGEAPIRSSLRSTSKRKRRHTGHRLQTQILHKHQAVVMAPLRRDPRNVQPMALKPTKNIAQVAGSGTPATVA
jgi:hypothetical protein